MQREMLQMLHVPNPEHQMASRTSQEEWAGGIPAAIVRI